MNKPATLDAPVPAAEFTRNFGRYRMLAQREAVAVSSHGTITGYFLSPEEYDAYLRYYYRPRAILAVDLTDEEAAEIATSRMDPRHDHLNALLDE